MKKLKYVRSRVTAAKLAIIAACDCSISIVVTIQRFLTLIAVSEAFGAMFVTGFLIFGLTVETLNLAMATAFYAFTVAVLLAACQNAHYEREVGAAT